MNNYERAADYRRRAVATRRLAAEVITGHVREGFLAVAAEYDLMANRLCPENVRDEGSAPQLVTGPPSQPGDRSRSH